MSLDLERGKKPSVIEMPPLPPEEVVQEVAPVEQQLVQEVASEGHTNTQEPEKMHATEMQSVQPDKSESAQARNFRELREKGERAAKERDELAQQIKELKSQLTKKDDFNLNPDDLVEGKHLAQVMKEQKELKEQLRQYSQQRQLAEAEIKLKSKYADFDQVVNESTILALKEADPKAAEAIKASAHDPEAAFSLAYMAIKFNNLVKTAPKVDMETQRAQQNAAKPRPLNTVSAQHTDSPISRMNAFAQGELTPEMQKQHYKEMQEARKGY